VAKASRFYIIDQGIND